MLIKDKLLPEEPIEHRDEAEHIRGISSMNDIETVPQQHLEAQQERHEQGNAVFQDVRAGFLGGWGQLIAIDMDAIDANV